MEYVRKFDRSALKVEEFDFQMLSRFESCLIMLCRSPIGAGGPRLHVHEGDQLYYVIEGSMTLRLDGRDRIVEAGSVVFIAAGTPHANWNSGDTPEVHIDIVAPAPAVGRPPHAYWEDGDADNSPRTSYVSAPDAHSYAGLGATDLHTADFQVAHVASPATGSFKVMMNLARNRPGEQEGRWHIHDFDQFYYVLDGALTVDVANKHYEVEPDHLVVIPAGVPHRNWNAGDVVERHVLLNAPSPVEQPFNIFVDFGITRRELIPSQI
jgi:quercetin dioxygenase-like cupin family protein